MTYEKMHTTNLQQLEAVGWLNLNEGPQLPEGTAWKDLTDGQWSALAIPEDDALAFEAAAQLSAKYLWTVETGYLEIIL